MQLIGKINYYFYVTFMNNGKNKDIMPNINSQPF